MRKDRERGAIVVEATLSLTAFVFALFTLLSIVNIYYIQAKMSVALNAAAKDIAQYSYLYYKLGIDKHEAGMNAGTEDARETAEQTIDGIGALLDNFSDGKEAIQTADFESLIDAIDKGMENVDSLVDMYGQKLADDPKGFIVGMGKLALNEGKEILKSRVLGQVLGKAFMKKNLKAHQKDDPDDFLKRYRVVNGMKGVSFNGTALMAYGTTNQIQLVVTYDVQVIRLLNIDFTFTFRQAAKTTAWGNGISLIHPDTSTPSSSSVWDIDAITRGKTLVLEEKKKYTYTSSGHGFDAYNNAGGANEFISIISRDTHAASYSTAEKLRDSLVAAYNDMYGKVEGLGEEIDVQTGDGKTVTLNSDPSTRTYKLVLVVPDDADMSLVQQAIKEFEERTGATVEVRTGYGSPTPKETPAEPETGGEG